MIERHIASLLRDALADTPVVALHGPRQCGKTTLAKQVAPDFPYITLDDPLSLQAATQRPSALLAAYPEHVIIDEIQRAPELFRAIKAEVDRNRRPGRFLLTGSANVMLLPKMSDSLAGRMEVVPLLPLSRGEILGGRESFLTRVFSEDSSLSVAPDAEWREAIEIGGFPEPRERKSAARREAWFSAYVKALIDRDVRDIAEIEGLRLLPGLLSALARQVGQPLNLTSIARETGIPVTSVQRYVTLLEAIYLVRLIPAWTVVKTGKVAKTAKVAFVDSGLLHHLGGGASLENFVTMEIVKQTTWAETRIGLRHFRSLRAYSVPIVLQRADGRVVGIHVVDRERVEPSDFRGLEFLADVVGPQFHRGIVLYAGDARETYTNHLSAWPLSAVWQS